MESMELVTECVLKLLRNWTTRFFIDSQRTDSFQVVRVLTCPSSVTASLPPDQTVYSTTPQEDKS